MPDPTITVLSDDDLIAAWDRIRVEEQLLAGEIRRRLITHRAFRLKSERSHPTGSPAHAERQQRMQAVIAGAGF